MTLNGVNPKIIRTSDNGDRITIFGEDPGRHRYRVGDILELTDQHHASQARYTIKRIHWPDKETKEYVLEAKYLDPRNDG
jgi:hypothetical protein